MGTKGEQASWTVHRTVLQNPAGLTQNSPCSILLPSPLGEGLGVRLFCYLTYLTLIHLSLTGQATRCT